MRRRPILASLGVLAATISGCTRTLSPNSKSEEDSSGRAADIIYLYNVTDEIVTLSFRATNVDSGETRIDRRFEIGSHERERIINEVFHGRDYELDVSRADGYSETAVWKNVENGLHVLVKEDNIVFAEQFA